MSSVPVPVQSPFRVHAQRFAGAHSVGAAAHYHALAALRQRAHRGGDDVGGGSVGDEQHVCVKSVLTAGIEAVEQIEVHGEAYRAAALAKLGQQAVIPSAGEYGGGHAGDVALEDYAVIILHVARYGEVEIHALERAEAVQDVGQRAQLAESALRGAVHRHAAQLAQHVSQRAVQCRERRKALRRRPGRPGLSADVAYGVGVARAYGSQQLGAVLCAQTQRVYQPRHKAHVRDVQHIPGRYRVQAAPGEHDDLAYGVAVHVAEVLQTGLGYLLKAQLSVRRAVDALVIVDPHGSAGLGGEVLRNGERDVRLERHETPVGVRKGYDPAVRKKAAVLRVEVVLLKFAHAVGAVAVSGVERAQRPHGSLLLPEYIVHGCRPFTLLY